MMSAIRDMTEHKRVERALNENAEFRRPTRSWRRSTLDRARPARRSPASGLRCPAGEAVWRETDEHGRISCNASRSRANHGPARQRPPRAVHRDAGALVRSDVNVSALAESIVARLRSEPQRDVRFDACRHRSSWRSGLLRIALENCSATWKFTGACAGLAQMGRVEIEASVLFGATAARGSTSQAPKLQAFQRLHPASAFEHRAATVQRIVRRHGGRVWAEVADRGATFFTVPGVTTRPSRWHRRQGAASRPFLTLAPRTWGISKATGRFSRWILALEDHDASMASQAGAHIRCLWNASESVTEKKVTKPARIAAAASPRGRAGHGTRSR